VQRCVLLCLQDIAAGMEHIHELGIVHGCAPSTHANPDGMLESCGTRRPCCCMCCWIAVRNRKHAELSWVWLTAYMQLPGCGCVGRTAMHADRASPAHTQRPEGRQRADGLADCDSRRPARLHLQGPALSPALALLCVACVQDVGLHSQHRTCMFFIVKPSVGALEEHSVLDPRGQALLLTSAWRGADRGLRHEQAPAESGHARLHKHARRAPPLARASRGHAQLPCAPAWAPASHLRLIST